MIAWLAVAAGGAIGALLRYGVSGLVGVTQVFPWATLTINIAGSFAIGMLWGWHSHAEWFQQWGRLFLVVGVLGGFTTFSAFSLESFVLFDNGKSITALTYVLASVAGCLLAVFAGMKAGDMAGAWS